MMHSNGAHETIKKDPGNHFRRRGVKMAQPGRFMAVTEVFSDQLARIDKGLPEPV